MKHSRFAFVTILATFVCLAISPSSSQTQAICSFKFFQAPGVVNGVNDYGTTVGQDRSNIQVGFIRYSNGGVSNFTAPNSAFTTFTARNDGGVSTGSYSTQGANSNIGKGFILHGSTFTSFTHPKSVLGTNLSGINKYNTTVGWYLDAGEIAHGFKRYSNGGLAALDYPGSQDTNPAAINDSGVVVGSFDDTTGEHGFLYHSGTWAKLDYPGGAAGTTQVVGISNANAVVGFNTTQEPQTSFLYSNGTFKAISVPNSFSTLVTNISGNGLISGTVVYNNNSASAFIATCK